MDFYSYHKWNSYCTHCIHAANVKNSCKSCCLRSLIFLAWRKLCMHLKCICLLLRPFHVFWLKYSSVYTFYLLTIHLVLRYFLDLIHEAWKLYFQFQVWWNLPKYSPEMFLKMLMLSSRTWKIQDKISHFCVFCFLFNWLLFPRITYFLVVFKCFF